MKHVCATLILIFNVLLQVSWATSAQAEPVYPTVIIGAGPGGLNVAYQMLVNGEPFVIYTRGVGGPIKHGGIPETWKGLLSWEYHARHKLLATRLGCSTTAENEIDLKKEILCFVNGMIKAIGPDCIKSGYELVEVKTSHDPEAPIALLFRVHGSSKLETVYAKNVDFAIPPADLNKVKFEKIK